MQENLYSRVHLYLHHSLSKEQDTVGVLAPNSLVASSLAPFSFSFSSVSTPCRENKQLSHIMSHTDILLLNYYHANHITASIFSYSPMPPPAERWRPLRGDLPGPFFSSSAFDESYLMNAPFCGISSQSEKRIPSPRGRLDPASVCKKGRLVQTYLCLQTEVSIALVQEGHPVPALHQLMPQLISFYRSNFNKPLMGFCANLHSGSWWKCASLARSNQPSSAMNVVHLLCWNPRLRLVIWKNAHAIFPSFKYHTET